MTTSSATAANLLPEALRALGKLIKAAGFYPHNHPSLEATLHGTHAALRPTLAEGRLELIVKRTGFQVESRPLGADDPFLQKLAGYCFSRRINKLYFLPELQERDLLSLARILALDPETVGKHGGAAEMLVEARSATIWANEIDLSRLQEREEEDEILEPEAVEEAPEEGISHGAEELWEEDPERKRDLETLLWELQQAESDPQYEAILGEILPKVWDHLNPDGRSLMTQLYFTLVSNAADPYLSPARRERSREVLEHLGSEHHLHFLIEMLCVKNLPRYHRAAVQNILVYYTIKALPMLLGRLIEEQDSQCRHQLIEVLRLQPPEAIPYLLQFLKDPRWYVVRNAALLLGELRHPSGLAALVKILAHPDSRVRRETLRAITKIGGPQAARILIRVVEKQDPDLSHQALISMGAIRDPAVVAFLREILHGRIIIDGENDLRGEAIRSLAQLGARESVPDLIALLGQRKWFRRGDHDQIRAAAARALGDIGDPVAREILEEASRDRATEVAQAARLALRQLHPDEKP